MPLQAGGVDFDPSITQGEFEQFARLVSQGIYATPVEPAHARSLLGFDVGVAVTAVPVDTDSAYWQRAGADDLTFRDHVMLPRIVAAKGLGLATVAASYARVSDSDAEVWGAAIDVPLIDGGVVRPTLALRGAWSTLRGVDDLDLTTYGIEAFVSKGFGPVTPYLAAGIARGDATGRVTPQLTLEDASQSSRITAGVKFSFFIPKFVVEVTQGEVRSYAAKVSFGL